MSRQLRYLILLLILVLVVGNETYLKWKVASWDESLQVRIYAINADNSNASNSYINRLRISDFVAIEKFVNREARRYGINIDAIRVSYGGELADVPPQPPVSGSAIDNIIWSLKFRFWAWFRETEDEHNDADINLYVNYFDVATRQSLQHSAGLRGGLIALINGFADRSYRGSNNVVITHELMHTFGASDKYGRGNQPVHPDGFADPFQDPLYPQTRAEIMGGRIPVNASKAKMPDSLSDVVVNVFTASEIHWPVK
ncbi:MAG: hypothetical protein GY806_20235 [Gammaproteobacteria bacterium]|nr:hypothetical protein [Gammaproteobacteria bacterium]